jgi:hypothetical protein
MAEFPTGWGIPGMSEANILGEEQRQFDALAAIVPQRLMARDPKPPNKQLLDKVIKIQEANGIESGFCFLYLSQAIFGKQFDWLAQLIGSCVASGDMRTTAYRMLAEVFLLNDPEEIPGTEIVGRNNLAFFAPYNYRAGRREGGINGNSDGSFCMAHIKGKMKYGHLPCDTPGLESDLFPEPRSTSLYRRWGANNELLDKFAEIGRKYPLLESSPIKGAADAKKSIVEGFKPANICSSWSFVPDYQHPTWKDEDGQPVWIWKRGREPWYHNMSVIGHVVVNGQEFDIVENSWHNYHRGRKWFAIPATLFDTWGRVAECQNVGEIDMTDNPAVFPEAA